MSSVEWGGRPRPREGYDYVAVYLTVARVEVEHVGYRIIGGAVDWEVQPSILIDAEGNRYQEEAFTSRGVELANTAEVGKSYDLIEGTTMILVFELPRQEEPMTLAFVFPFADSQSWEGWMEKSIVEWGQIDIVL